MCACLLHVCFYSVSENLWVVLFPHYGDYLVHVTFSLFSYSWHNFTIHHRDLVSLCVCSNHVVVHTSIHVFSFETTVLLFIWAMLYQLFSLNGLSNRNIYAKLLTFFSRAFNFLIFRYWFSQWCTCNTWCRNKLVGVSCFYILF